MTSANRIPRALAALALAAALTGCAANALNQARAADQLRDDDLAVAEYMRALREHPDNRDAQLGLQRAKLRAAEAHATRGRKLYGLGRYEDAVLELQLANELNPTNNDVERDLRAVRAAVRAKLAAPADGKTANESLIARARDLPALGYELPDIKLAEEIRTGAQATSRQLYLTLASLGKLSVIFDSSFRDAPAPATLLTNMTIKQALDAVAKSTTTFYRITGQNAIIVVPDTPAKQREYIEEVQQVFVLQNADLTESIDVLRVVSDIRTLQKITAINAIAVRDTPDRVRAAGRLLNAIDKAKAELAIDVEIMEVNRSQIREYGLQFATAGSPGIDGVVAINESELTAKTLSSLSRTDLLVSGLPALFYRLLKTDTHTRTLANPHLRMSDGIAVTEEFGENVPIPKSQLVPIVQGGVNQQEITQYEYKNIGVNITLKPRVHANDEVTIDLTVELTNIAGAGFNGLPTFGNRRVNTQIRLKDGETNILAGLIRDDERTVRNGIPGLSDIPAIGRLFGKNHKERQETEVIVMLTPHIIRVLELTEADLRPLRIQGAGPALMEGGPIVPGPPIRGGGPGDPLAAMLPSFPITAGVPAGAPMPPSRIIRR